MAGSLIFIKVLVALATSAIAAPPVKPAVVDYLYGDVNEDGAVDSADRGEVNAHMGSVYGDLNYLLAADVDQDGEIDSDDSQEVVDAILFGNGNPPPGAISSHGSKIGYAGAVFDPSTGMYLMRHRWYDPGLGRFITRDPAGYVDGMNLFVYALGNPIVLVDPLGLEAWYQGWGRMVKYAVGGGPDGAAGEVWSDFGSGAISNPKATVQAAYQAGEEVVVVAGYAVGAVDSDTLMEKSGGARLLFAAETQGYGTVGKEIAANTIAAVKETGARIANGDLEAIGDVAWGVGMTIMPAAAAGGFAARGAAAARNLAPDGPPAPTLLQRNVELGRQGELAEGIDPDAPKPRIVVNGRNRYPDQLNKVAGTLTEVKNVQKLSYTQQLRAYQQWAYENNVAFHLKIRQGTQLSGPLQEAVDRGDIVLHRCLP